MSDASSVEPLPLVARLGRSRTLLFDLATSYFVSFVRAASMFAIVALLSRRTTAGYLAAFLFLRYLIGFLGNLFAGAQPAALAALAPRVAKSTEVRSDESSEWTALLLANLAPAVVCNVIVLWCHSLLRSATNAFIPPEHAHAVNLFVTMFTIGTLGRVASDAAGGVLQLRGRLWLDNLLVSFAEIGWVVHAVFLSGGAWEETFTGVGEAYCVTGVVLFSARWLIAAWLLVRYESWWKNFRTDIAIRFLGLAGLLAFASLGDFLYAPFNNIIITRYLDPLLVASYGPALQVDALLLLAVSGIAGVMLPRVVQLYTRGEFAALRHAYIAAMLVGTLLLAGGAGLTLTFRGPVLRLWLGDVPPHTAMILPWVLTHTVLGGAGGISRAMLLGLGRFRAWTISTLAGGITNVVLAYVLAVPLGFGLRGIVCATILIVTLKNAIWMPWYVLRTLRTEEWSREGAKGAKANAREFI